MSVTVGHACGGEKSEAEEQVWVWMDALRICTLSRHLLMLKILYFPLFLFYFFKVFNGIWFQAISLVDGCVSTNHSAQTGVYVIKRKKVHRSVNVQKSGSVRG